MFLHSCPSMMMVIMMKMIVVVMIMIRKTIDGDDDYDNNNNNSIQRCCSRFRSLLTVLLSPKCKVMWQHWNRGIRCSTVQTFEVKVQLILDPTVKGLIVGWPLIVPATC